MQSVAESEYRKLLEEQIRGASGQRLEQLKKQGEGERKLLVEIVWPVRKTFRGIVLEKEFVTQNGAKAYIDSFDEEIRFGLEGEGFVPHAENITRPRFDFEKARIRSMLATGILYVPFTYDEMDKKTDWCIRSLRELYGIYGGGFGGERSAAGGLSIYEREFIRQATRLGRPFGVKDVQACTEKKVDFCYQLLKNMCAKMLIRPTKTNPSRNHLNVLEEGVVRLLW